MPIYSYACNHCQHSFEKMLSIADRHLPTKIECPNCGEEDTVTMIIKSVPFFEGKPAANTKTHGAFKEVIQQIKKNNRGNDIPDY